LYSVAGFIDLAQFFQSNVLAKCMRD